MAGKQGKGAATRAASRTRNWATVVYPDSAPENWRLTLSELHVPAFISPLHDSDINPDGEKKKAHYHVLLMFEGPKSVAQVEEVFNAIGGVGHEIVQSVRGYARYLCHMDNPEKAQYSVEQVVSLSGADFFSITTLPTDRHALLREMQRFVRENSITAYSDLVDYAADNCPDWYRVLMDSGSWVMREYIRSISWKTSL